MASAKLNIYNLGSLGVNVDKSPIHLEDGELVSAQNAIQDKHGYLGAIQKRPGLTKHHTVAAAGSILGFAGVPLGPGPGTGTDDVRTYYVSQAGGSWYKSSNSFSSSTTVTTPAALNNDKHSVMIGTKMYYSSSDDVRVWDGIVDALFCKIDNIIQLSAVEGQLYVATHNGSSGFVYQVDETGRATQIGQVIPASYVPHDVMLHQNDLFVACTSSGATSRIYRIRLDTATTSTAWTLDFTSGQVDTALYFTSFLDGLLYMGEDTGNATASSVYRRSTAGVYTAVDTGGTSGGSASGVSSIITYQGRMYAHWDHFAGGAGANSVVRRSSDGTTWATVLTYAPSDAVGVSELFDTGSKIFAIGRNQTKLHYSADGSSWTSVTQGANLNVGFGWFAASGSGPAFGATQAFEIIQGGSSLQIRNASGSIVTLTLPAGITLDTNRPPRFTMFGRYVVMANTPSRPITIDADGIVRVLTPLSPTLAITLDDDGGAGNLTGDYKARQTYVIKDRTGNIISESDMSPVMDTAFTAAADTLDAETLNLSADDITGNKIYRTTAGGSTYFPWIDVDGQDLTQSVSDDRTDAQLELVAAPVLGSAPYLSLLANWRDRLWGVDRAAVDDLRYTETGLMYSWPAANSILVGRRGSDIRGITAIIARRDALGVARRDSMNQITGTNNNDFRSVVLSENVGVESQETVIVYKDKAYFLWKDGVYTWSDEGIECISDGQVRSWFASDTYFNRARFPFAFATLDPTTGRYKLFLAAAGSSSEDRWVEYDLNDRTWWGPHKTDAFSLASAGFTWDSGDHGISLIGSTSGFLWKEQSTRTDDTSTGIAFDVTTKRHSADTPDIEKLWLQPSFFGIVQAAGTLTITPSIGELNASSGTAQSFSLTLNRQRLARFGVGKHLQLRFTNSTAGQNVILTGYEIPYHEVGRR